MNKPDHKYLVIPGPVEVRREILEAQTKWMIGHRSNEFATLFGSLEDKLKQVFLTQNRVLISGSSGTGLWEGASRNAIRDDKRVLHLIGGAFSERWAEISKANGKQVDLIEVPWGQAHTPQMVIDALQKQTYDAVAVVHNETSTGVTNPIKEIGEAIRQYGTTETLYLVDTVSGFLGTELRVDDWGIDMALTSSQKAFALPPGLAFATISDRLLARAKEIPYRGYYFDFIEMEANLRKNNTHNTPPISLMFAADVQLDAILAEGLENRWARHSQMRELTHEWAFSREFGVFAQEGYRSNTVTAVDNREQQIDVDAMAKFMSGRGYSMDKGYGSIKGKTFRIAHMGDMLVETLQDVLGGLDAFIAEGK